MICAHDDDIKREKKMKNKPKAETAEVSVTKIMLILEQILIIFFCKEEEERKSQWAFPCEEYGCKRGFSNFQGLKIHLKASLRICFIKSRLNKERLEILKFLYFQTFQVKPQMVRKRL